MRAGGLAILSVRAAVSDLGGVLVDRRKVRLGVFRRSGKERNLHRADHAVPHVRAAARAREPREGDVPSLARSPRFVNRRPDNHARAARTVEDRYARSGAPESWGSGPRVRGGT